MFSLGKEIIKWLNKPRSWWIDESRWIPKEIAETVRQHSKKVEKAAVIYGKHFPHLDQEIMRKMAKYHDLAEYKEEDYKPWEISKEEKHQREKVVMLEIQSALWWQWDEIFDIWMEHEESISETALLITQLDKLDAAIQALEYEKMWYNVTEFYDYTLKKLLDPILIRILKILLDKPYPHIDSYKQYFFLLQHSGNEKLFHQEMKKH